MRPAPPAKQGAARTEQIILFRVGGQLFAVSSASVQEVRSVDSLGGSATELSQPGLRKVRHIVRRGGKTVYVVNGAMHFGLPATPAALVFVLRGTGTAVVSRTDVAGSKCRAGCGTRRVSDSGRSGFAGRGVAVRRDTGSQSR